MGSTFSLIPIRYRKQTEKVYSSFEEDNTKAVEDEEMVISYTKRERHSVGFVGLE